MTKAEKIALIIIGLLLLGYSIFYSYQVDKGVKKYTEKCERIGWDVCEAEYYSTHTPNGLPK